MNAFSRLALVALILCSLTVVAVEVLTVNRAATMTCSEAVAQLKDRVALSQQLGDAFLQTNQALVDVYSVFGDKLSKMKSASEANAVGASFLNSARTTKESMSQSTTVVENLKAETDLLMARVLECIQ